MWESFFFFWEQCENKWLLLPVTLHCYANLWKEKDFKWLFYMSLSSHQPNATSPQQHFLAMITYLMFPVSVSTGGTDKSLAQPTSWCCRTEWIVLLERGVCSCAELQVFSCYRGWKKACQAMGVISTAWRHELSSNFFPARQGAEGNSHHSNRNIRGTCTIICHCQKLGGSV